MYTELTKKDLDIIFEIGGHLEINFNNDNNTKYHYHYLDLIKINIRCAGKGLQRIGGFDPKATRPNHTVRHIFALCYFGCFHVLRNL